MNASPNIILVHGAWADGPSWSAVIERLQADGYDVTASQFPLTALADDVARLRHVLGLQSGPTIVAGHSYGGQIMTALGTDAPNVVGLVYIAAFGLDEGESIGAMLSGPWSLVTPIRRARACWRSLARRSPTFTRTGEPRPRDRRAHPGSSFSPPPIPTATKASRSRWPIASERRRSASMTSATRGWLKTQRSWQRPSRASGHPFGEADEIVRAGWDSGRA
jgi:pimeloyl-ACP methyl ester carboxylesterase